MDISTRLLSVVTELVFIPAHIEDKKYREIFDKISEGHFIRSYTSLPDTSIQMTGSKEEHSDHVLYKIMKDRLYISYEYCTSSIAYYSGLIKDFVEIFSKATGLPLFLMHGVTIRKLINIKGIDDSRDFLIKKVFKLKDENFKTFNRPIHMMGGRIFFPPVPEDTTSHEIKIESSMEDYKTLFVEDKANFPQPIDLKSGNDIINKNINLTDEFINNNTISFLMQFV